MNKLISFLFISIILHIFFIYNINQNQHEIKLDKEIEINLENINSQNLLNYQNQKKKIKEIYKKQSQIINKIEKKEEDIKEAELIEKEEIKEAELIEKERLNNKIFYGDRIKNINITYLIEQDLGPTKGSLLNSPLEKNKNISTTSSIGMNQIEFRIENNEYQIDSNLETNGVSIFYPSKIIQKSNGFINENGLNMTNYYYETEIEKREVVFKNNEINLVYKNKIKKFQNYENEQIQDQLSFLFQFMFFDVYEKNEHIITNGKKLKKYKYEILNEEMISIGNESYQTLHVRKYNTDNQDKVEFFLGKDSGYIPLKLVYTEKDQSKIILTMIKTNTIFYE